MNSMNDPMEKTVRHFLTLSDTSPDELNWIIERAIELKKKQRAGEIYEPLKNRVLGMIFEKSSTRTRVSFEAGMSQLGGSAIFLSPRDTQLGRGEPVEDSARVLSRMVDVVMIRTFDHDIIERFAAYSSVPVINALSDLEHPCQALGDLLTIQEHKGRLDGVRVAFVGDGNTFAAIAGIPAITHGPNAVGAHTIDEKVPIRELERVALVYALTAIRFCSSNNE